MSATQESQSNSHICIGILAHVDAGKTTLSESLLYLSKEIPSLGRVDKGDAFLDTAALERERGITIFSKQAELSIGSWQVSLLDTPGHVDFSAEMERTLQVLDYGILVISAADGIQGHTCTLWKLLERYGIPVFLFINKMDQPEADREHLMQELQTRLDSGCLDFATDSAGIGRGISEYRYPETIVYRSSDPGTKGISLLFWFCFKAGGRRCFDGGDPPACLSEVL